jgi:hypothetical protein
MTRSRDAAARAQEVCVGPLVHVTAYVVVALVIVSALSGGGDDAKATDKSDTEPAEPAFDLAVNAGKLSKPKGSNELAADQRDDGKTLKVTGVVDKIDTDIWEERKYILILTDGSEWAILWVGVEGLSAGELAKVNTGDKPAFVVALTRSNHFRADN